MKKINPATLPVRLCLCFFIFACSSSGRAAGERSGMAGSPDQKSVSQVHAGQFGRLWLSRRQRAIAPQLLKMLSEEPLPALRERIVVALGRLEDPRAIVPLQSLLVQSSPKSGAIYHQIPTYVIQLALGRIKARSLRGSQKLNVIAHQVGKTWPSIKQDARRLQLKLQDRMGIYEVQQSEDKFILDEFYDVLYRMGKHGEDIRALGAYEVLLWPQQKPLLDTAKLTDQAERRFWIKRALPPTSTGFYPSRFLDVGIKSDELLGVLKQALAKVRSNPTSVAGTKSIGCQALFLTAVALNDPRFIPVLTSFSKVGDRNIRFSAASAVDQLRSKSGLASVKFP